MKAASESNIVVCAHRPYCRVCDAVEECMALWLIPITFQVLM